MHPIFDKTYDRIHRWGRACLHCGSDFVQESLFCKICESTLWKKHGKISHSFVDDIPVFSLFSWEQDQDRQVSMLLKSTKRGLLKQALKYYAQEFILRENPHVASASLLIPCPGSRPDHASVLAAQFSVILDLEIGDILEKTEAQKMRQKQKTKLERSRLRFSCQGTVADRHVIFIDDIVTSGATIRAAKQAIGPCQSFQVWTLAQRVVSLRAPC